MSIIDGASLICKYEDGVTLSPDEKELLLFALYSGYKLAVGPNRSVAGLVTRVVRRCAEIVDNSPNAVIASAAIRREFGVAEQDKMMCPNCAPHANGTHSADCRALREF